MSVDTTLTLGQLPSPIVVCDDTGVITSANSKAKALLSLPDIGVHIDSVIEFSTSNIANITNYADLIEHIKSRQESLRTASITIADGPISHIDLLFTFFQDNGESRTLIELINVSDKNKLLEAFEYKQNLLDNILSTSTDALIVFDHYGDIELFSPAAEKMFETTAPEMIIESIYTLFSPEDKDRVTKIFERFKSGNSKNGILVIEDIKPTTLNGRAFPASITFSKSERDTEYLFFMIISDTSLFNNFVNSVNDAYIKTDESGRIIEINNKVEILFHYDRRTLINKHISFLELKNSSCPNGIFDINTLLDSNMDSADYITKNRRGAELTVNLTSWPQEVNNTRLNNIIIRDISQRKVTEKKLMESAFTDSLTSLSNRASFNKALKSKFKDRKKSLRPFALLGLDLDKFKAVNDTLGHDYGDELLQVSATRLLACVRENDLVSRMGGDEFSIILEGPISTEILSRICNRILNAFRKVFSIKGKRICISSSIGIAQYPKDADNEDELIKAADMAMYSAKRAGKDAFRFYSRELYNHLERYQEIETALMSAIENDEFYLVYQPKVSYSSRQVVGVEALLRWSTPSLGNVGPDEFIPIAEETGQIIKITQWVFNRGIQQLKLWKTQTPIIKDLGITLALNISAEHFKYDIFADIDNVIRAEGIDRKYIEIEVTEGILVEDMDDAIDTLKSISDYGISISLDDFGTGYSSLQYLKQFPLNTLKIDRVFVKDIATDEHNLFIIEAIISIAKRLNLNLVAEGVEKESEIARLVSLGCDIFQGYYFSKPLRADEIIDFIVNFNKNHTITNLAPP